MYFQIDIEAKAMLVIQKKITNARIRLRLTTCLYLNPNNRARSLSTLIVVIVCKDTADNIVKLIEEVVADIKQRSVKRLSVAKNA